MNVVAEIKPYLFLGSAAARTNDFLQKTNITLVVNGERWILFLTYFKSNFTCISVSRPFL